MIETYDYTMMDNEDSYQEWHKGIVNENFDPEKVDDFNKWKKKQKE